MGKFPDFSVLDGFILTICTDRPARDRLLPMGAIETSGLKGLEGQVLGVFHAIFANNGQVLGEVDWFSIPISWFQVVVSRYVWRIWTFPPWQKSHILTHPW